MRPLVAEGGNFAHATYGLLQQSRQHLEVDDFQPGQVLARLRVFVLAQSTKQCAVVGKTVRESEYSMQNLRPRRGDAIYLFAAGNGPTPCKRTSHQE